MLSYLADWLNIGAGDGTFDRPLKILDESPEEAAVTEHFWITEAVTIADDSMWSLVDRKIVEANGRKVIKTTINCFRSNGENYVTEEKTYFFYLQFPTLNTYDSIDQYEHSIIPLPLQLGWVEFADMTQNDEGLDYTYSYESLYITASLYVYDFGGEDVPEGNSELLQEHFMDLIQAVRLSKPNLDLWSDAQIYPDGMLQSFKDSKIDFTSILFLGAVGGVFVKLRLSYPNISGVSKLAWDTVEHVRAIIQEYSCRQVDTSPSDSIIKVDSNNI